MIGLIVMASLTLAALSPTTDAHQQTLTSILTNHVVEGAFKAEDLVPLAPTTVTTLAGFPLVFDVMEGGGATIGGIEILATDVEASNGACCRAPRARAWRHACHTWLTALYHRTNPPCGHLCSTLVPSSFPFLCSSRRLSSPGAQASRT